jgi:hypothetical protein
MVLTMMFQEELEKDPRQRTWKYQSMNLLTIIQLRLDNKNE